MTEQHPITPPPELLSRWEEDWHHAKVKDIEFEEHIATQAARWGADQELEACCEWQKYYLHSGPHLNKQLCAARRPKPPSLKEQALAALGSIERGQDRPKDTATIRRALEQLDD